MAGQLWDRYDIEVFCQHCGNYLATLLGIKRKNLAKAHRVVRQEVEGRAGTAGPAVEVTRFVTLKQSVMVEPPSP